MIYKQKWPVASFMKQSFRGYFNRLFPVVVYAFLQPIWLRTCHISNNDSEDSTYQIFHLFATVIIEYSTYTSTSANIPYLFSLESHDSLSVPLVVTLRSLKKVLQNTLFLHILVDSPTHSCHCNNTLAVNGPCSHPFLFYFCNVWIILCSTSTVTSFLL